MKRGMLTDSAQKRQELSRLICSCLMIASYFNFGFRSWSFMSAHHRHWSSSWKDNQLWQSRHGHRRLRSVDAHKAEKILYIVTSMAEFDSGRRETKKGHDRFSNTIVPLVHDAVSSMMLSGYDVDLFFISHYKVSETRQRELSSALPEGAGLEVWDEATPVGYASEKQGDNQIWPVTRGLARQHRYVIKDKYLHYDIFVNFEDDMLVRGQHVEHFVDVTNALYELRQHANATKPKSDKSQFYGEMKEFPLSRTIPGFMRVEVSLPGFQAQTKNLFKQIPIDYRWSKNESDSGIDPSICCAIPSDMTSERLPEAPEKDSLYFWETSIDALGVRRMPQHSSALDWVLLLGGTNNDNFIGDYWSGRGKSAYFGKMARPDRKKGRYLSNQGGWMATKFQMFEWHTRFCRGGFLPPYNAPEYKDDGLHARSVEFWSGGLQLAGLSCVLQRVVTLDPTGFSKHLLYHTSNNKQRQDNVRHRFSGRSINQFWGQLNTVKKNAETAIAQDKKI